MVVLLDWNEKIVFDKKLIIDKISYSIFENVDNILNLKWFLSTEGEDVKKVNFFIKPESNAFSFSKSLIIKKNEDNIFKLRILASKLPDKWSGELLVEAEGFIRAIPLEFHKNKLIH